MMGVKPLKDESIDVCKKPNCKTFDLRGKSLVAKNSILCIMITTNFGLS